MAERTVRHPKHPLPYWGLIAATAVVAALALVGTWRQAQRVEVAPPELTEAALRTAP